MSSRELSITLVMDNTASASNILLKVLNKFPGLYMTPEDVALVTNHSPRFIRDQIRKGALPAGRSGGKLLRIHKHDVFLFARNPAMKEDVQ